MSLLSDAKAQQRQRRFAAVGALESERRLQCWSSSQGSDTRTIRIPCRRVSTLGGHSALRNAVTQISRMAHGRGCGGCEGPEPRDQGRRDSRNWTGRVWAHLSCRGRAAMASTGSAVLRRPAVESHVSRWTGGGWPAKTACQMVRHRRLAAKARVLGWAMMCPTCLMVRRVMEGKRRAGEPSPGLTWPLWWEEQSARPDTCCRRSTLMACSKWAPRVRPIFS